MCHFYNASLQTLHTGSSWLTNCFNLINTARVNERPWSHIIYKIGSKVNWCTQKGPKSKMVICTTVWFVKWSATTSAELFPHPSRRNKLCIGVCVCVCWYLADIFSSFLWIIIKTGNGSSSDETWAKKRPW